MILPALVLIGVILIIILFVDHYRIHGYWYDNDDFKNAFYYLTKSHEGLIFLIIVLIIGIVIGDTFT